MKLMTLGRLGVEGGGLRRQKPLLLLAYLAVEGVKPRRHLAELFFAQTSDPLNSLSRALSNLRKESEGLVEADSTRAWTTVGSDVVQFLGHADAGDLGECETLYEGAFAEDLNLELNTELEEWVLGTREYLAGRYRDILLRLGEVKLKEKNPEEAARYGEKAYSLTGASELEPEHLIRVYQLLTTGHSPKAPEVREEAESFGIELPLPSRSSDQAQETAQTAHNLPLPKSSFVGRDPELLEIAEQLAHSECRLLTLHGTGGVGKSRLALQAAYEASETGQFKDGITFVPLDSLTSADLIPSSLAEALKLTLSGQGDTLTQVIRALNDTHSLIILDNFEHLMDGTDLVDRLLNACPNLKLIVTSRERLRLEQEWVLTLTGLTLPEDETEGLEQLQNYDALNLFSQRAKRTRLDFALTNDDLPYALKICQLVDGYPLGIELSAVWVKLLPLQDIATEIEKNVDILTHGTRNALERHQSIRAVFEHSWKLLTKQEQDVLMKLSVFVGGFRREAAAEVANATLPILASLVDKSLLRVMPNGRYDRHPLLYQFMEEKLQRQDEQWNLAHNAHRVYFISFTKNRSYASKNQNEILKTLENEIANIKRAFFYSITVQCLISPYESITLRLYFERKAKFQEGIDFFGECLSKVGNTPHFSSLKGALLVHKAKLFSRIGKYEAAISAVSEGVRLLQGLDDLELIAEGFHTLGAIFYEQGKLIEGKRYFSRVLKIAYKLRDHSKIASMLNNLAAIEQLQGNYARSMRFHQSALEIYEETGNDFGVVVSLKSLGELALESGLPDTALAKLWESFELAKKIHYELFLPDILVSIANTYYELDETERSIDAAKRALSLSIKSGDKSAEAISLLILGSCMIRLGKSSKAIIFFRASLDVAWDMKNYIIILESLFGFAKLFNEMGNFNEAINLTSLILHHELLGTQLAQRAHSLLEELHPVGFGRDEVEYIKKGEENLEETIRWLINIKAPSQDAIDKNWYLSN